MPSVLGRRPPDGGWGWVVLAAGFFSQMVGYGSPQSQGALYPEWLSVYAEGKSKTAWVGSLVFGSGPLLGPLWSACVLSRGPRWCVVAAGLVLFCGYVLSAFAPNVSFLIVSYGFLVGVGGGLLYMASVSIICQYFDRRRGIALAILTVGNSVGGIIYSSLQILLIQVYGLEGCLLLVGALSLHTMACGGLMRPLTPRPPSKQRPESESRAGELTNEETASSQRGFGVRLRGVWQKLRSFAEFFPSMDVLQNRRLMALCVCLFLFCLGNVPYQLFIEDFAQSTGLDSGDSGEWVVPLVSLILIGNLSGKLLLGLCADLPRVNSSWLYSATVGLGGVCVICIPLSSSYLQLQFISFFLGFFGANWTLTAHAVSRLVPVSQFEEAHGVLLLFGGVAVVVGPPVAGVFSDWLQSYDVAFFVSGACMISGSLVLFTTLSLSCLRSGPEQSSSPTLELSQEQDQTGAEEPLEVYT